MLDALIINKYGDRKYLSDKDDSDSEAISDYTYNVQGIVFSHLNDWAKMYSALLKDYEPLWNVDGTEVTTYGETHKEDKYGATHSEDKYGNAVSTVAHPQYSDVRTTAKTTYPDATERNTDKVTDQYGQHTITTTDQLHTDEHDERLHTNEFDEDEHDVTVRRTGNIGVTETTTLIGHTVDLYTKYNFWQIIFAMIFNELGVDYYD